jgi:hypothetical protein
VSGNRLSVIVKIPVATPSKTWVYVGLLVGNAGTIPAEGDGCLSLVNVVCCQV